jgi:hypothetical protein
LLLSFQKLLSSFIIYHRAGLIPGSRKKGAPQPSPLFYITWSAQYLKISTQPPAVRIIVLYHRVIWCDVVLRFIQESIHKLLAIIYLFGIRFFAANLREASSLRRESKTPQFTITYKLEVKEGGAEQVFSDRSKSLVAVMNDAFFKLLNYKLIAATIAALVRAIKQKPHR